MDRDLVLFQLHHLVSELQLYSWSIRNNKYKSLEAILGNVDVALEEMEALIKKLREVK